MVYICIYLKVMFTFYVCIFLSYHKSKYLFNFPLIFLFHILIVVMNVYHTSAYINLYVNWFTSLIVELRIMISKAMGEAFIDVTQPDKLLSCVINKEL